MIVDVAPNGASALFLDFDERRELVFRKLVENINFKDFLASQAGSIFQKSWEGKYFFKSRRRLVVLADAAFATTIPIPLDFRRNAEIVEKPITLDEVEDWFAHAIAKVFTKCRLEAGRRLGTGDVDTVLVGQRIDQVAIDGRVVIDPVGHSGKKVSFVIELTFASRELSETLAPFFNSPGEFFFAEAPQVQLSALARILPLPVSIITARDGQSSLFVFQEAEKGCVVVYREPFLWDGEAVIRSIVADLGIPPSVAEEIYSMYVRGEVSDAAKKHLDTLVTNGSTALQASIFLLGASCAVCGEDFRSIILLRTTSTLSGHSNWQNPPGLAPQLWTCSKTIAGIVTRAHTANHSWGGEASTDPSAERRAEKRFWRASGC